jgi:hypothetical protein
VRILFDQGVPVPLRGLLEGHTIVTAHEKGWARLSNGELLGSAEDEFDVLITTDQSLSYQQNLTARRLAILILPTTRWPAIKAHASEIVAAIAELKPGDYRELTFQAGP